MAGSWQVARRHAGHPPDQHRCSGAPVTGITSDFSRSLERHTGTTLAARACPAPFRNELPHTRVEPSWPVTIGVTAQHSAASASDGQQAVERRRPAPRAQVAHRGGPAACESRGSIRARSRASGADLHNGCRGHGSECARSASAEDLTKSEGKVEPISTNFST